MSNKDVFIFWNEEEGKAKVRCHDGKFRTYGESKGFGSKNIKECMSLHSIGACKRMARTRGRCGWINTRVFSEERGDAPYIRAGRLPPS